MRHQQRLRVGMLFTASLWMVGCQPTTPATSTDTQTTQPALGNHTGQSQAQKFQNEVAPEIDLGYTVAKRT